MGIEVGVGYANVREEKFLLYPPRVSAGPKIKLTLRQKSTGEEHTSIAKILHVDGSLHKRTETQRNDQSRKLIYLLDTEMVNS